ncbi:MAG: indole-3-glycerol phosphate synthase TrpC [Acidimicrobiales bacterium]
MATYLDGIVTWHRARAAADGRDPDLLLSEARQFTEEFPVRSFERALTAERAVSVIAELKRRSPSKGDLDLDIDASTTARQYEKGGAACLSVLTDLPHFAGCAEDLLEARRAVTLPVLRKDFTVSISDVYDARLMGADAILLIVAALSREELELFISAAESLGMAALVEVHDEEEVGRALAAGARLVGVNQRDLHSFELDPRRAVGLSTALPLDVVRVAESGITQPSQLAALADAGYDAVLIGESLVRAADRVSALRAFTDPARPALSCG